MPPPWESRTMKLPGDAPSGSVQASANDSPGATVFEVPPATVREGAAGAAHVLETLVGSSRPIFPAWNSVNQIFPSGATATPIGYAPSVGTVNVLIFP